MVLEKLLEIEGDYTKQVTLEIAKPDERAIGVMTDVESRMFCLATLVDQSIKDTIIELEAAMAETAVAKMRAERTGLLHALSQHMPNLDKDAQEDLNMRASTHACLVTCYEWSIRDRLNQWTNPLVVRKGWVAHVYGT
jgi:hypothetical protein